jgi:hypothetical protein
VVLFTQVPGNDSVGSGTFSFSFGIWPSRGSGTGYQIGVVGPLEVAQQTEIGGSRVWARHLNTEISLLKLATPLQAVGVRSTRTSTRSDPPSGGRPRRGRDRTGHLGLQRLSF